MKNGKDNPMLVRLSRKYIKFLPVDRRSLAHASGYDNQLIACTLRSQTFLGSFYDRVKSLRIADRDFGE